MTLIEPGLGVIRWFPDAPLSKPHVGQGRRARNAHPAPRTLADALDALQASGALTNEGEARIRTARVQLPDGGIITSVAVTAAHQRTCCGVVMQAAHGWTARTTLGEAIRLEVERLDGATADPNGNVQLRDGTYLYALEAVPIPLAETLSKQHEAILRHAIRFLKAEAQCYRALDEALLPGFVVLDYAAIAKLGEGKLPSLKAIERHVLKEMPELSRQAIATALALAGIRRPRSGPRSRRPRALA